MRGVLGEEKKGGGMTIEHGRYQMIILCASFLICVKDLAHWYNGTGGKNKQITHGQVADTSVRANV